MLCNIQVVNMPDFCTFRNLMECKDTLFLILEEFPD